MNNRLRVALYVNDEQANMLRYVRCLRRWNMSFRSLWRDELAALQPGDADVLLLHGGWYGIDRVPGQDQHVKQAQAEHTKMAAAVRGFVAAGGGIVGVCAGAFNVVWLDLIKAEISRSHGVGPHSVEVVDETHPILTGVAERAKGRTDRKWQPIPLLRVSGPIFFPAHAEQMVLSYDWEQRMGAVLAADYERGRAVAISPHPEYSEGETAFGPIIESALPAPALLLRNALYWSAGRTPLA